MKGTLTDLKHTLEEEAPEETRPAASNRKSVYSGEGPRLDVPRWLRDKSQEFREKREEAKGRTLYHLETCPAHTDHDGHTYECCVMQRDDGQLQAHCKHSEQYGWQDFKAAIGEPNSEHWIGKTHPSPHRLVDTNGKYRPETVTPTYTLTDDGNADRLVSRHGDSLRHCYELGWLAWDGKRWAHDRTGEVRRRAVHTVKTIGQEAAGEPDRDKAAALFKYASRSLSDSKIKALISCAESKLPMPVQITEFDTDPYLMNLNNGTLDLHTGELKAHRREDLLMKLAPVGYDPQATCPRWLQFLDRIMDGDADLIAFLQKAVGYSLTGSTAEECILILFGVGANGKSTFLETIEALLGDYAKQTPTETLMMKRADSGNSNDVARLVGARLVLSVETEEGRRFAEAKLKQLTGGDKITARFLHQEYFEFVPEFKLWLACNHKPVIRGTDVGTWRRIRLIPFDVQIPEGERDPSLKGPNGTLRRELPGILNWALEGCKKWQAEGLQVPALVSSATAGYQADMDTIGTFISDRCYCNDKANVSARDIYAAYVQWCAENGENAVSQKRLGMKLTERSFVRYRAGGGANCWHGIGLHVDSTI